MTHNLKQLERWILPDGIGEVLPAQARATEELRRQLLDLYARWGYELIIPPLLEFTESLLVNTNKDLDLQTFKVTDQLSGRTMGIRADITPQAARIDAHSLNRDGPVRLCYAGSVLHTRSANALASRSPIQLGVECFGIDALMADCEVISLMIETLRCAGVQHFVVSLGHVEIFRKLSQHVQLNSEQTENLLNILQRKATVELAQFTQEASISKSAQPAFMQLLELNGKPSLLTDAKRIFSACGINMQKELDELADLSSQLMSRYPGLEAHVDLAEVPGYHYHNGVVFAAYASGSGAAIANGGRYDALCALFGRSRPATGFNADLKTLLRLSQRIIAPIKKGIAVLMTQDAMQWNMICDLRQQGETVVCFSSEAEMQTALDCDRQIVKKSDGYLVAAL